MKYDYAQQKKKIRTENYWLLLASELLARSLRIAAGIMSMLAILSPPFSLMATEPRVFLLNARI